jgi:hypothetical protein
MAVSAVLFDILLPASIQQLMFWIPAAVYYPSFVYSQTIVQTTTMVLTTHPAICSLVQ